MKNTEVFRKDPTTFAIPNDGVTTIQVPQKKQEWDVLEFELRSFVCEGEYKDGLERILSTFFSNLNRPKQPAVWISGFYGSGKSHLARVLEYLWKDIVLPDGALASSLVDLPQVIDDQFVELKTHGKREGGLWSAAGTLSSAGSKSVRLALLSIVFNAAGLPDDYRLAKFVIWLKQNDYYEPVKHYVEGKGKKFEREIRSLYVSPIIANAILKVYPGFANSPADARALLKGEYPKVKDISNDEFGHTLEYVLEMQSTTSGKLPLTLLVFDELQQFIGEKPQKAIHVQEIVQYCTARFGSKILFVGTGQSSLEADVNLSRLKDRFTVKVQLDDKDVERVVRNVVLRKKQDKVGILRDVLEKNMGEIDRHLQGTKIGPMPEDEKDLVADYPLLPTRRRFWGKTLRAIDIAGTAAQLRTQLRVTHEAVKKIADEPVGTVVPADVIYTQQEASMLQSGVLPREVATMIGELDDGTEDGKLASRLCALIFIIGKLPTKGPSDTGIRATARTLADLLIKDLTTDSADIRKRIPAILQGLVEDGTLMLIDQDEYRLQTREGAEWEVDFLSRFSNIRDAPTRIASERSEMIRDKIRQELRGFSLVQGRSKTPRKIDLFFGQEKPSIDTKFVPVWIRDEWDVTEKTVREDAQSGGDDDSVVYVFLPRTNTHDLKRQLAEYLAAKEVVETHPKPSTSGGMQALQSMKAKREIAHSKVKGLINNTVKKAKVYQGGGNLLLEDSLVDNIKAAAEASLARMFPNFGMADHPNWSTVVRRAQDGNPSPLEALGYQGETEKYPVCREVRSYLGGGKKGSEIRDHFTGSPFGWPRDAIDGAILSLLAAGSIRAQKNAQEIAISEMTVTQISSTNFFKEGYTIGINDKLAVKKLLSEAKVTYKVDNEIESIPDFLSKLTTLAENVAGDPPLPETPDIQIIKDIQSLAGNERFVKLAREKETLLALLDDWEKQEEKKRKRLPQWKLLLDFDTHGQHLDNVDDIERQIQAIRTQRVLLDDPNPVRPVLNDLKKKLIDAVRKFYQSLEELYRAEYKELQKTKVWQALDKSQQDDLLEIHKIDKPQKPNVQTEQDLLDELKNRPIQSWQSRIDALPVRFEKLKVVAAKILAPEVVQVTPKNITINNKDELDQYLNELRKEIEVILDDGNPVYISRSK